MNIRKIFAVAFVFAIAVGSVFAGGGQEDDGGQAAEPILIGVAGPHSGDLSPYGLPTVNAVELVVEEINAAGGVLGRPIELVIEDDQCAPEVAANTAAKLVSDGVVAVIGHICSGATGTALAVYSETDILAISPSATNPGLAEYENFFRTIAPDDAQARLQVDYVVDELGLTQIALLHDRGDYGKGLSDFAQAYLQEVDDADVVLYDGVTVGAVDYSAIINRVRAEGAEVVIWGGYHPEASKLVEQMRSQGMDDVVFVGGDGIKGNAIVDLIGDSAEGVYATGARETGDNPLAAEYTERHIEVYGSGPGDFFMEAVSAALALFNAIEVAGSTNNDDIINALRSSAVQTPVGEISFDQDGNATGVGFAVFQVQNGEYVEVAQ